jgi:amidase
MKTIEDIVAFSEEHAEEALQNTDMTGLTDAIAAGSIEDQDYLDNTAALVHGARDEGIDLAMDGAGVDALIAPTSQLSVDVWSNEFKGSSSNIPSLAGYPCVTLPIGLSDDLPGGINFFGRAYSEADLLAFAFALEQLLPPRAVPTYIPREE